MANDIDDIELEMRRFLRGFATGSWKDAYRAYRTLYRAGPAAIPAVEGQLRHSDWKDLNNTPAIILVTALVALLRDIDEPRSDRAIERIIAGGCHAAVMSSLKSIQRYRNADFRIYDSDGIRVFEATDIDPKLRVQAHLTRWLEIVPPDDLREIERLYVLSHHVTMDYSGQYMPILRKIVVVWYRPFADSFPLRTLSSLLIKSTLYHEIGHHVHRHDFGQQPEQEREANRYSARLMAKAHPFWAPVVRTVGWVLKTVSGGRLPAC